MQIRLAPYLENVGESGLACLLTMVGGNVAALTSSHWLVASETGLLAGAIATTTVLAAELRRPWIISLVLGLATAAVDAFVHGPVWATSALGEALFTGAAAFALSAALRHGVLAIEASRRRRAAAGR